MAVKKMVTEEKQENKLPYVSPAIVYEGLITARAGSLSPDVGVPGGDEAGVNPVDLFGGNG